MNVEILFGHFKPRVILLLNQIKNISHVGIDYIDKDGNLKFIDFETCYNEWVSTLSEKTKTTAIKYGFKCVGNRNSLASPPYIEFFAQPITRLEFSSYDDYSDTREKMERIGWRTHDLT